MSNEDQPTQWGMKGEKNYDETQEYIEEQAL